MRYLNSIDYGVILLYCCIIVAMGLYLWRQASKSLEDYFLAGRNLPWWALGVSGMTNFLDMTGTMIIVSFLYMLGPRGLYVEFRGGAVLVLAFMMLWTGKWHYRSQCMTEAEWMIYRFGTGPGAQFARVITAVANVIWAIGMLAYLIKGAGLFLSMFLPFPPITCAVIMVGLTTLYTLISGFYGVVYNDLFQSAIILAGVIIVSTLAATAIWADPVQFAATAQSVSGNTQWMSSFPHLRTSLPKGYEEFQPLAFIAFIYLFRNVLSGIGSGADPRYFGARSERDCGKLSFFWTWLMTFRWPMMMGFAALGILLVSRLFPDQTAIQQAQRSIKNYLIAQKHPGVMIDYDRTERVADIVPTSAWVDAATAIQAAQQSPEKVEKLTALLGSDWRSGLETVISQHKLLTAVIPKDQWEAQLSDVVWHAERHAPLVQQLQSGLGDDWARKVQLVSFEGTVNPERILPAVILMNIPMGLRGLFICSLVAAAMSTLAPQVNAATAFFTRDIWQAYLRRRAVNRELIGVSYVFGAVMVAAAFVMAYKTTNINAIWDWIIMGLTAGIAVPRLLRLYWWRFNGAGVFWGTLVGLVIAVGQRAYFTMHPELPDWGPTTKFFVITGIALIAAILGTYTGPPTERGKLEHFYRTTRPFGLWGPLRDILSPAVRNAMDRENHRDLITVPFALLWQITLFLLPMQVIIGNWRDFAVTAVLFAIGLGGVLLLWVRHWPTNQDGRYESSILLAAEQDAASPDAPTAVAADVSTPVKA